MKCPQCDDHFSYQHIFDSDGAEEGEPFECPLCSELIRMVVDEGTYMGAQDKHLEIVDD
jgi:hypothetical protein